MRLGDTDTSNAYNATVSLASDSSPLVAAKKRIHESDPGEDELAALLSGTAEELLHNTGRQ